MPLRVSVDGYVGPSGRGAWAVVVDGAPAAAEPIHGEPSHLVEWRAMRAALEWLEREAPAGERAVVRTDSVLVARGVASRRPEMSGEAAEIRAACRQTLARLAAKGVRVEVVRVRREENAEADALARRTAEGP